MIQSHGTHGIQAAQRAARDSRFVYMEDVRILLGIQYCSTMEVYGVNPYTLGNPRHRKMKKQTLADRIAEKKTQAEARKNAELTAVEKRLSTVKFESVKVYNIR